MALLRTLTLIYTGVLTVALAGSLGAILAYLLRIAGVLGDVRSALDRARSETEALDGYVKILGDAAGGVAEDVQQARDALAHADEQLAVLAGRRGSANRAP